MSRKAKRYVIGLSVMGALGIIAALAGIRVRAQDVPPMVATGQFGLMGAVRGEVARLNVSNINAVPPDPCHVILAFVDAAGEILHRPEGGLVQREVTLAAGQSAFLQFQASSLMGTEARLNFRPVLLVPQPGALPPDPCVPSLEIINGATGQTRLVTPGAARTYAGNHNETLVQDR